MSEQRSIHLAVNPPAVEHLVQFTAKIGRRRRCKAIKQRMVASTSDDYAAVTMPCKHHAQPPGVEMEAVDLRKPSQGMEGDHKVEFKAL